MYVLVILTDAHESAWIVSKGKMKALRTELLARYGAGVIAWRLYDCAPRVGGWCDGSVDAWQHIDNVPRYAEIVL